EEAGSDGQQAGDEPGNAKSHNHGNGAPDSDGGAAGFFQAKADTDQTEDEEQRDERHHTGEDRTPRDIRVSRRWFTRPDERVASGVVVVLYTVIPLNPVNPLCLAACSGTVLVGRCSMLAALV